MIFDVSFPGLGIEHLKINREAFSLFGVSVYWYGILIASAVLLGIYLASRHAKTYQLTQDDVTDSFLIMIPAIILFARAYYVIFSWESFRNDLWTIFDTRRGGLAFYGGVIGGMIAFAIICAYKKKRLVNWFDFFVVYLPLGQAIGRWGNFINQEAFGTNTTLPWGMISNGTTDYLIHLADPSINPLQPVHPTFLYESLGNLVIFGILLYVRRRSTFHLETTAWYLMLYGVLRFFVESIRTDALFIGQTNLRISMVLSLIMFIFALLYLSYGYLKSSQKHLPLCLVKDWSQKSARGETEVVETDEENAHD